MTKFNEQSILIPSSKKIKCPHCGDESPLSHFEVIANDAHSNYVLMCPCCLSKVFISYDYISDEVKNTMPNTSTTSTSKVDRHRSLCTKLNQIYEKKNHDYGDSFHKTFEDEGYAMARIRLSDKLERFKTLTKMGTLCSKEQKVRDESIEDTLMDLANYALMTILEIELEREEK